MDAGQRFQPLHQVVQLFLVVHIQSDIPMENPVLGFHGEGVDVDAQFSADQVGDLVDDTDIVDTGDLQACEERDFLVFCPFGFDDPMAKIRHESGCVGAICRWMTRPLPVETKPNTLSPGMGLQQLAR